MADVEKPSVDPAETADMKLQADSILYAAKKVGEAYGTIKAKLDDGTEVKSEVMIATMKNGKPIITKEGRVWLRQQERKRQKEIQEVAHNGAKTEPKEDSPKPDGGMKGARERLDYVAKLNETSEGQ